MKRKPKIVCILVLIICLGCIAIIVIIDSYSKNNENYIFHLAMSYERIGEFEKSEKLLKSIVYSENDLYKEIRYSLARVLFVNGKFEEARSHCNSLLDQGVVDSEMRLGINMIIFSINQKQINSNSN